MRSVRRMVPPTERRTALMSMVKSTAVSVRSLIVLPSAKYVQIHQVHLHVYYRDTVSLSRGCIQIRPDSAKLPLGAQVPPTPRRPRRSWCHTSVVAARRNYHPP